MAGSLMARLRARLEEMQPEAGFDRSAYGYDEDGQEDATFEEVDLEEESPWRRPAAGAEPSRSGPAATAEAPSPPRGQMGRAAEVVPPRAPHRPRPAAAPREAPESPWARGGQSGGRVARDFPSPPPREASAPGRASVSPPAGSRPASHGFERRSAAGASRLQRFRQRIRHPDSLRELFLLREVIDRPIALRRPRARR